MAFSSFLESRRADAKLLAGHLKRRFQYVSILGADVRSTSVWVDRSRSGIDTTGETQCGFVVKVSDGGVFFEYSLDDLQGDMAALAEKIAAAAVAPAMASIDPVCLTDEPLVQSFARPHDLSGYDTTGLLEFCKEQQAALQAKDTHILNSMVDVTFRETSKLFVSPDRELDQNYSWVNGVLFLLYRDNDKTVQAHESSYDHTVAAVLADMPGKMDKLVRKAHMLTTAKPIVPGVYDVITDPSITGLIAHEAFGHGVEMDQFVKDRALAREYMGKYVASPITNMRDGAAAVLSAASYFFDDDGVLAHDTQIIKDGILVAGLSDLASAVQLGTSPTGNGRRESTRRKTYTRMTNTFFEAGTDKLEDMIASVEHGYMLFECSNGMEDPKNWAIQCVAQYGVEIVDGKLTDNWVSPVVMSGYVPDLLRSISMVSDGVKVSGTGGCGKGYKEFVRVSDGGPSLKARVKLG